MTTPSTSVASPAAGQELATTRRSRGRLFFVVALVVVAVAGVLVWRGMFATSTPDNVIVVSGRIEGDDAAVASKVSGRIVEVLVREGDAVKAGDVIAKLDDAQARARAAHDQVPVLQEQQRQAQLHIDQAKVDATGRVQQAEADLAAAQAQLAQQKASYDLAVFDRDAYQRLAETGAVSERQAKVA